MISQTLPTASSESSSPSINSEGIGGYSLVRVGSRAEAIELAKRYPHAKWGLVEVREVLYFDPT